MPKEGDGGLVSTKVEEGKDRHSATLATCPIATHDGGNAVNMGPRMSYHPTLVSAMHFSSFD